jgi:hypothetical protein
MLVETICCICGRQKRFGDWRSAGLKPPRKPSHGYCPECFVELMERLGLDAGPVTSDSSPSRVRGTGKCLSGK